MSDEKNSAKIQENEQAIRDIPIEDGEITAKQASQTRVSPPIPAPHSRTQAPPPKPVDNSVRDARISKAGPDIPEKDKVLITANVSMDKVCVGGKWYHFEKGHTYSVPANVKKALMKRPGLLRPTI